MDHGAQHGGRDPWTGFERHPWFPPHNESLQHALEAESRRPGGDPWAMARRAWDWSRASTVAHSAKAPADGLCAGCHRSAWGEWRIAAAFLLGYVSGQRDLSRARRAEAADA